MAEPARNADAAYDPAGENWSRYTRALDAGHRDFVTEAVLYDKFYSGDQWDEADRRKLERQGRPAMTMNLTLPTINAMVGEFVNRQADFSFKPKRGAATETVAGQLTKLVMAICDANRTDFTEKQVVEDALITGRGYFDVRLDFTDNILGEVRISKLHPREVIPDPTARDYDPSTWNEVMTTRWLSLDEIEALYGSEKARELANTGDLCGFGEDAIRWHDQPQFGTNQVGMYGATADQSREGGRTIRQVRVIDRQYYRLSRAREFIDPVTGELRPVPENWNDAKIQLYMQAKGLEIRARTVRRVRWTVSAAHVTLWDDWSPYPSFTVVPLFCYFRPGRPFGAVKNLRSPQEILNKVESQKLHVVNTTANSGWIVDAGALINMTVSELEERGAETGLVIEKAPNLVLEKIQPNQVPTGLDRVGQMAAVAVREISGVNMAMLGQEPAEVSGVALQDKRLAGALQMQTIIENLRFSRLLLAQKILELVQRFYSEERVFYINGPDGDTEELIVNQMDAIGRLVNDLTVGEYDVVVGSMPARDNFDDSQFAQALQLREAGVMIPDHRVVQYSGLYRKAELVEEVKQITGFGEMTEEQMAIQQLTMQTMQAELEQLLADIEDTRAGAALKMAQAQSAAEGPQIAREQMQADMATTQVEQTVRLQVQRLKELSSQLQKMMDAQVKVRTQRDRERSRLEKKSPTPEKRANVRRR